MLYEGIQLSQKFTLFDPFTLALKYAMIQSVPGQARRAFLLLIGGAMRDWYKRLSAAGLCLSLLMGQAALASDALGHDLHSGDTVLSQGTVATRDYLWSDTYNDLRTERYVTYTPNEAVSPTVAFGANILERETLSHMAQTLEAQGKRVVGGTNGDFYVLTTGQPLGMVVTDGVLRSSSSYHSAIGFRADGTAFVGTPNLHVSMTMGEERLTVFGGVNKVRQIRNANGGGLTLLTPDFGANTQNIAAGVDVFLRVTTPEEELGRVLSAEETGVGQELTLSDRLRIGGRVRCVVDFVSEAAGANPIPEDGFVLTMNGMDDEGTLNMLRTLQPGDEVNIDIVSEDPRWNEAVEALGAMYRLLDNGQIGTGLSTERTARTAIGIKADGAVVFYTIDGKQPGHSVGATFPQVAQRLLELGCVEAVGLDGGGSTTFGLTTPAQETMSVVNRPSDGAERKNSTAIFLTTELEATGEPGSLQVEPGDALILAGTVLPLEAYCVDTGYRLMGLAQDVSYAASGGGVIEADAFIAGGESGYVTLTATQGELTGTASITVVRTPDEVLVTNEETGSAVGILALEPGESVALQAVSSWRKLNLRSQDTCYTWTCDEAVGTVTEDGYFTAGEKTAEGNLYVTAGEKTVTIPVSVVGHILPLADMEGENAPFTGGPGTAAELETNLAYVRTGRQSLRLDYELEEGLAVLNMDTAIPLGEKYLGLWIYGDGSANELTAVYLNGEEELSEALCTLDFTGWRHVLAPIPTGGSTLREVRITGESGVTAGTVWLDQLTTSNEELADDTPPMIRLKIEGTRLTATVSDNVDKSFAAPAVTLSYDGATLAGQWDAEKGILTAQLPLPEMELQSLEEQAAEGEEQQAITPEPQPAHRVSVTAVDVSGNLGRASQDIPGDALVEFADLVDHWAAEFVSYLYEQGVTNGVAADEGLYYLPNNTITRAEFFTMVARWMGLDLAEYAGTELPFADAGEIPEWAVPAVKAMYARGIVQGSMDFGVLYAYPNAGISRAEVMTILGRTQLRGWPETALDGFSDGADTPEWAESYVRSLVGQGIINGYEDGTLKPNASMMRGEVAKVLTVLR